MSDRYLIFKHMVLIDHTVLWRVIISKYWYCSMSLTWWQCSCRNVAQTPHTRFPEATPEQP